MNLRAATVADAPALAAVQIGALRAAGVDDVPSIPEELARWRALLDGAGAGWTLCAEDDGPLVGLVTAAPTEPETAAITLLCVLPDRQDAGVGAALLSAALDALRERGVRTASARPPLDDGALRALLADAGFRPARDVAAGPVPDAVGDAADVGLELPL